jgi:hypothetical protein
MVMLASCGVQRWWKPRPGALLYAIALTIFLFRLGSYLCHRELDAPYASHSTPRSPTEATTASAIPDTVPTTNATAANCMYAIAPTAMNMALIGVLAVVMCVLGFVYTNAVTTHRRAFFAGKHRGYRDIIIVMCMIPYMMYVGIYPYSGYLLPSPVALSSGPIVASACAWPSVTPHDFYRHHQMFTRDNIAAIASGKRDPTTLSTVELQLQTDILIAQGLRVAQATEFVARSAHPSSAEISANAEVTRTTANISEKTSLKAAPLDMPRKRISAWAALRLLLPQPLQAVLDAMGQAGGFIVSLVTYGTNTMVAALLLGFSLGLHIVYITRMGIGDKSMSGV